MVSTVDKILGHQPWYTTNTTTNYLFIYPSVLYLKASVSGTSVMTSLVSLLQRTQPFFWSFSPLLDQGKIII